MPTHGLGARLERLRRDCVPAVQRRALGEALGYTGDSAYQMVYEWETGRRAIPADLIPDIARCIGKTICDIYGQDCNNSSTNGSSGPKEVFVETYQQSIAEKLTDADRAFLAVIADGLVKYRQQVTREGLRPES